MWKSEIISLLVFVLHYLCIRRGIYLSRTSTERWMKRIGYERESRLISPPNHIGMRTSIHTTKHLCLSCIQCCPTNNSIAMFVNESSRQWCLSPLPEHTQTHTHTHASTRLGLSHCHIEYMQIPIYRRRYKRTHLRRQSAFNKTYA